MRAFGAATGTGSGLDVEDDIQSIASAVLFLQQKSGVGNFLDMPVSHFEGGTCGHAQCCFGQFTLYPGKESEAGPAAEYQSQHEDQYAGKKDQSGQFVIQYNSEYGLIVLYNQILKTVGELSLEPFQPPFSGRSATQFYLFQVGRQYQLGLD